MSDTKALQRLSLSEAAQKGLRIMSKTSNGKAKRQLDRMVRRYRDALEQIAALSGMTEVRGPFEDIGVPEHMVKEGGWVPIHPRLKDGLNLAAKIAKVALDDPTNAPARNRYGYLLDDLRQPKCLHCGESTNKAYREMPNLKCWNCGREMTP